MSSVGHHGPHMASAGGGGEGARGGGVGWGG
jgi:hypothetical protein